MTTTIVTSPDICCPPRPHRGVGRLARAVWASIKRWEKRRRDIRHLRRMSDQQLNDIGLRRAEIEARVHGHEAHRVRLVDLLPAGRFETFRNETFVAR